MDVYPFFITDIWLFRYTIGNKPLIRWMLMFFSSFMSVIGAICAIPFLKSFSFPMSKLVTLFYCRTLFEILLLLVQAIIVLQMDWSKFQDYINYFEQIRIPAESDLVNEIKNDRRNKILIQLVLQIIQEILVSLTFSASGNINLMFFLFYTSLNIGWLFYLSILNDSTVCLSFIFKIIGLHISKFEFIGPIEFQRNRLVTLRKAHLCAIKATNLAEKFFRLLITFKYIRDLADLFVVITAIFFEFKSLLLLVVRLCSILLSVIRLVYLTINLNRVHCSLKEPIEHLYGLSMKLRTDQQAREIDNFLSQMSQIQSGFTFGNLMLITPNFITSLLTLTFTISIGLFNFMQD